MRFAIFPVHLSEVLCLPRQSDARSYEVLHLLHKIISANLKIWCSKMQPLSENQRPGLLTALMNMSLVLCLPRKMHLCRSSSNVSRLPSFLEMPQNPHVLLTFGKVHNPLRLPRESTSEPPKVARTFGVFNMLTSKCASRHNGVHFFDIATSKSGPNLVCFVHFDFEMCFAPQRHALFRHRNFQEWSGAGVFLYILTSKRASRYNGVQFFISHLASWLRARRFRSLLFDPPEPQIIGKTQCFATFLLFRAPASSFFTLSLLWSSLFCSSLFYSSLFYSSPWLFPSLLFICPYCRNLTSKLPSIKNDQWPLIVYQLYEYEAVILPMEGISYDSQFDNSFPIFMKRMD